MLRTQNNRAHSLISVAIVNTEMAHTTQTDKKRHRALKKNNVSEEILPYTQYHLRIHIKNIKASSGNHKH